jgi:hypothetical protein
VKRELRKEGKKMKRRTIVILVAAVALLVLLWAMGNAVAGPPRQEPKGEGEVTIAGKINYKGRLTDAYGKPLDGTYTITSQEYPPGMVSYWKFDEGAGTIAYDSVGTNHGDIYGATWTAGILGSALNFDGDDYVLVPRSDSLEPAHITVEACVKRSDSPGSYRYIVGKYLAGGWGSYGLYSGAAGGLSFYIGDSSYFVLSPGVSSSEIWDGRCHHVAGTYDGSKVRLYLDGVEVGTGTPTTISIYYTEGDLSIGRYGTAWYYSGLIDEVAIYNRALSAEEIEKRYSSTCGAHHIYVPIVVKNYAP